ncbi:MAG: hypothetical protein Q4C50_12400, partial [Eubacteriales bacterium]|nr:hypothetical protein [Eubacteriales bacterium]
IGLKENVIIGKLIPAGTGMRRYRDVKLDISGTDDYKYEEAMAGEITFEELEDEPELDLEEMSDVIEETDTAEEAAAEEFAAEEQEFVSVGTNEEE